MNDLRILSSEDSSGTDMAPTTPLAPVAPLAPIANKANIDNVTAQKSSNSSQESIAKSLTERNLYCVNITLKNWNK